MIRREPPRFAKLTRLDRFRCKDYIDEDRAMRSIGTLGGGNHFVEVDKDASGDLHIVKAAE
jgi:RNA-splicing ligase RtcB